MAEKNVPAPVTNGFPLVDPRPPTVVVAKPKKGQVMIQLLDGRIVPRGRGRPPKGSKVVPQ